MGSPDDDILIFKLRNMGKENERKVEAPRQQPAAPVKQTAVQQQQKQVQPAAGQDRQEKAVRVQPVLQEAKAEPRSAAQPVPKPEVIQQTAARPKKAPEPVQPQRPMEISPSRKAIAEQKKETEESFNSVIKVQESGRTLEESGAEAEAPKVNKKVSKNEKSEMAAAKGLSCVNHPWRQAYAICNYCSRPFCYADLMEHDGNFYCIEDLDQATDKKAAKGGSLGAFAIIAALLFIINSGVLAYFAPGQIFFVGDKLLAGQFSILVATHSQAYYLELANFAVFVLGIISCFAILSKKSAGFFFGAVVAAVSAVIISYQYLNDSTYYLLGMSVIAFIEIVMLTFSRMSAGREIEEEELNPMDIDWPRPEVF
jgi:hypothetical protein